MLHKIFKCRRYKLDLSKKTYVMGVLNVTPDSFSDGGSFFKPAAAYGRALQMEKEGADIIDIGGESSRPGSLGVTVEEELARVVPLVRRLRGRLRIPISVDTTKAEVARQALSEGASIINDISGLNQDQQLATLCAYHNAGLIIMHMKGSPLTMQKRPTYADLLKDISSYLKKSVRAAIQLGVKSDHIIIDPGIGFGKRPSHNLRIIKELGYFKKLGYPVLIGLSRKSFMGKALGLSVDERLVPTISANMAAVSNGADIIRVHDVKEAVLAARMADAISAAS